MVPVFLQQDAPDHGGARQAFALRFPGNNLNQPSWKLKCNRWIVALVPFTNVTHKWNVTVSHCHVKYNLLQITYCLNRLK